MGFLSCPGSGKYANRICTGHVQLFSASELTILRSFNNSANKRVLNCLEAGYLKLGGCSKRITVIEFGVNGGAGGKCKWQ